MGRYISLILQFAIGILAFYVGFQQLPKIWANYQLEGQRTDHLQSFDLAGKPLPLTLNSRKVLVFWATWCGPCETEIDRLKNAVAEGKIKPEQVLLISLDEDPELVSRTASDRQFPFELRFDQGGELARAFQIRGTPTIVMIDEKNVVHWMTVGLSPTLIWRATRFLN